MDASTFQVHVRNKMRDLGFFTVNVSHWLFGVNGEAGELTDFIKKKFFYKKDYAPDLLMTDFFSVEDVSHIKKEIGDVIFYCTALAEEMGLDLNKIMEDNIDKLNKRHGASGFNQEWASERIQSGD